MSLFLSSVEREFILTERSSGSAGHVYAAMRRRVLRRAETPGLIGPDDTVEWWHCTLEVLGDAAMTHAIEPEEKLGAWVRSTTLSVVRRPLADWIGPWFRNHSANPPIAELETAHLTIGVAAALDLCPELFQPSEVEEIRACLRDRAIPMSLNHLKHERQLHNHWCVIAAGLAVAAAVLDDKPAMEQAARAFELYTLTFQPDGTYAESLQYQNYACINLMYVYEALVRRNPAFASRLDPGVYAGLAKWSAYAHLYSKPLSGWGADDQPRSINFGDSAAVFVPSAELLLHIAARTSATHATEAKLARWLFDMVAAPLSYVPPFDRASFGFVNRPGFLTLPLLAHSCPGASPRELNLPALQAFGCGDVIARDAWDGRTTLAQRTGGDPMHVVSHVHGDMNSVVLVHNRERLLVDPGHSCYRSFLHALECSTATHSTCTFEVEGTPGELGQSGIANRQRKGEDGAEPPLPARTRRLITTTIGDTQVIASDAAGRYGEPIREFTRLTLLCGAHVIFIVDRIRSAVPVRTRWNWLLNNRNRCADLRIVGPNRLTLIKGQAGLKMTNCSGASVGGPQYAFVHDAYHPLPNQLGEGTSASGLLVHFREPTPRVDRTSVHVLIVDHAAGINGWRIEQQGDVATVYAPDGTRTAQLQTHAAGDSLVTWSSKDGCQHQIDANVAIVR